MSARLQWCCALLKGAVKWRNGSLTPCPHQFVVCTLVFLCQCCQYLTASLCKFMGILINIRIWMWNISSHCCVWKFIFPWLPWSLPRQHFMHVDDTDGPNQSLWLYSRRALLTILWCATYIWCFSKYMQHLDFIGNRKKYYLQRDFCQTLGLMTDFYFSS